MAERLVYAPKLAPDERLLLNRLTRRGIGRPEPPLDPKSMLSYTQGVFSRYANLVEAAGQPGPKHTLITPDIVVQKSDVIHQIGLSLADRTITLALTQHHRDTKTPTTAHYWLRSHPDQNPVSTDHQPYLNHDTPSLTHYDIYRLHILSEILNRIYTTTSPQPVDPYIDLSNKALVHQLISGNWAERVTVGKVIGQRFLVGS